MDERGIERVTYSDSELAAFKDKVAGPAAAAWVGDTTAKGLPAQELLAYGSGMMSSGS